MSSGTKSTLAENHWHGLNWEWGALELHQDSSPAPSQPLTRDSKWEVADRLESDQKWEATGNWEVWDSSEPFMCPADQQVKSLHRSPSQWIITLQIAPVRVLLGAVWWMSPCYVWFMLLPDRSIVFSLLWSTVPIFQKENRRERQ